MMLEDPYVEVALQAPPSPDYMPGPEEPEQAPPLPDYIPGPEHAGDEIIAEDQPYAEDASPMAQSPEYPFEMDESAATPPPHPAYRTIARISIPAPVPMPAWTDSEVARLLAISSPLASPLSPWSSPPPQIPFPPLPPILSPPSPILAPAPPPSPIQVTLPPRKRLDIALGPRYEVGESSSAAAARLAGGFRADYGFVATVDREIMRDPEREVGYGITDLWDEIVETLQGAPVSTDTELGGYVIEFETRVRQDMDEIYMRLDDEQTGRQLLAGRLNMRSTETSESRTALQGQITALQGQVTALQAHVATLQGQQGLAKDPTQPEPPEEAGGNA
nr:hypothetical protein [Tanacetum cinerariifolium]